MSVSIAAVNPYYSTTPPYHPAEDYPEYRHATSPEENPAYEGVREALRLAGYDEANFGTEAWNPLGDLINPGDSVFIKPNLVDHKHRFDGDVWSVITHPSVLRAVLDYVAIALRGSGEIILGDNPHIDTQWDLLSGVCHFDDLLDHYERVAPGIKVEVIDLRKWHMPNLEYYGFKMGREPLPGDPRGEEIIDIGNHSLFADVPVRLFRGTFNDRGETIRAHSDGHHAYSFSKTMLDTDVFISIPKLKAHAKVGVTLNLKGLIGTIINKNCLVHWRIGYPSLGGDEYPDPDDWIDYPRLYLQHLIRDITPSAVYFHMRRLLRGTFFYTQIYEPLIRTESQRKRMLRGAWDQNDTTWRMTVDVFNAFVRDVTGYQRQRGQQRRFLSIVDGIVGGDTDGPHFPHPRECGIVVAGEDFVEVDLVCARLMDFDHREIPYLAYLCEALGVDVGEISLSGVDLPEDFFSPTHRMLEFRPPHRWPRLSLHDLEPGPSFLPL